MKWNWIPAIFFPFPWLIQSCSVSFMVEIKVSWKLQLYVHALIAIHVCLTILSRDAFNLQYLSILMTSLRWPILSLHCVYIVLASYHCPYISFFLNFRHHDYCNVGRHRNKIMSTSYPYIMFASSTLSISQRLPTSILHVFSSSYIYFVDIVVINEIAMLANIELTLCLYLILVHIASLINIESTS